MLQPTLSRPRTGLLGALALAAAALFLALAAAAPAPASAAEALFGVDADNRIVTFRSDRPEIARRRALTGLPAGEQILGLDRRPKDQRVIALSSASRLYTLDVGSGALTPIGTAPFMPALDGVSFGFDFNPTVDRIRLTANTGQDLRLNPDTGATAAVDGKLRYAAGDPNAGQVGVIVASGYSQNFLGSRMTELYDVDSSKDVLAEQNPPNNGTLKTVGPLGVNIASPTSFDITGPNGTAYLVTRVAGQGGSKLYRVNVETGKADLVGAVRGRTVTAITVLGTIPGS